MNKTRRVLFGLFAFLLIFSPSLVSAEGGSQLDCAATPEECEAEIEDLRNENARYEDWFRENGIEPPALDEPSDIVDPNSISPDIEMTGGEDPPDDAVVKMREFDAQLHAIALTFCTDEYWKEDVRVSINIGGFTPQEAVERKSSLEALGWQILYDEYANYLQVLAADGYNVPSRPPTLWELTQLFPGCNVGEYEPGK